MTAPATLVEIEAKFIVLDRAAARSLLMADSLAGMPAVGPARRIGQVDTYLDTADARLSQAGWAARVRAVGDATRIQLKATTPADARGVQRRRELDGPALPGQPIADWPPSFARRGLIRLLGDGQVGQTVALAQSRLVREFGSGESIVEVSLDRIQVLEDGETRGRLDLVEVEQRTGSKDAFERALSFLGVQPSLARTARTKLAWARDISALRGRPDGLPIIENDPDAPMSDELTPEAGRRILRAQLRRLVDRERAFQLESGPEEIRRLRVATRRLRATWRTFEATYAGSIRTRFRRRLRDLSDALSAVRDLDVLLARLDAHRSTSIEPATEQAMAIFRAEIETRRAASLDRLRDDLAGTRHRSWLVRFAEFVETPGRGVIPVGPPTPRLFREQIGGWIWSGYERMLAWDSLIEIADAATLHDLRLETKRLRDVIHVAAPLATTSAEPILAGLERLQDELGAVNDAMVAAAAARAWIDANGHAHPVAIPVAVADFADAQEDEMARARRRAPASWRLVTSTLARRRMGGFIGSF